MILYLPVYLVWEKPETEIFDNFDMSPQDMDFEITEPDNTTFDSFLNLISSHTNMSSVPAKI